MTALLLHYPHRLAEVLTLVHFSQKVCITSHENRDMGTIGRVPIVPPWLDQYQAQKQPSPVTIHGFRVRVLIADLPSSDLRLWIPLRICAWGRKKAFLTNLF